jgi:cyclic pyranopterin phosphate synthase
MALRDRLGRRIDYIRVSLTERCNLRCIYCVPGGHPDCTHSPRELDQGLLLRFIRVALSYGLFKVRLTGGEPLLRHDIVQIVRGLKALGVRDLSLTTNGLLLPSLARPLREAGLDRVNISLDSLRPARYRSITGGGRLEAVFEALGKAQEVGLRPVKLNMVPIRGLNDDEVEEFARLTLRQPWHVRFIELMPLRRGGWGKDRVVTAEEVLRRISSLGELEPLGAFGSSRNYRFKGGSGVVGLISPQSRHFCRHCNRLRLTASGRLRPCLFSPVEIQLRPHMTEQALRDLLQEAVGCKPPGKEASADIPAQSMRQLGG